MLKYISENKILFSPIVLIVGTIFKPFGALILIIILSLLVAIKGC